MTKAKNSQPKVKNSQTKSRNSQNSRKPQPEMADFNEKGQRMTLQRKLEIANFRNLGIGGKAVLELNSDATKGDLIILVGENNSGKSNLIAAVQAFGDKSISEDDKPNFIEEGEKPSLRLVYSAKSPRQKDEFRQLDESFKDKVFNIIFTENSLETAAQKAKMSNEAYITHLKGLFENSQVLCLYDLDKDKKNPREEIRLILKDKNLVLFCSCEQSNKNLECFGNMKFDSINAVKNYNKAFVANCHFDIECEKSNLLDNATDLKKFLNVCSVNSENVLFMFANVNINLSKPS